MKVAVSRLKTKPPPPNVSLHVSVESFVLTRRVSFDNLSRRRVLVEYFRARAAQAPVRNVALLPFERVVDIVGIFVVVDEQNRLVNFLPSRRLHHFLLVHLLKYIYNLSDLLQLLLRRRAAKDFGLFQYLRISRVCFPLCLQASDRLLFSFLVRLL